MCEASDTNAASFTPRFVLTLPVDAGASYNSKYMNILVFDRTDYVSMETSGGIGNIQYQERNSDCRPDIKSFRTNHFFTSDFRATHSAFSNIRLRQKT